MKHRFLQKHPLSTFFLNEKAMLAVIFINSVCIYLTECGYSGVWLRVTDISCTVIFIIEMIVKHLRYGVKGYWSSGWNRMDGILVLISLPSLIVDLFPCVVTQLSFVLALRLLRVLRFFRIIHFFPNISTIMQGFRRALKDSYAVLLGFLVIIVTIGLINCALFRQLVPEYFSTPLNSIYTVFRLFTVEGWYEIPEAIVQVTSPAIGGLVRAYFCILLVGGGIIGMSFINSVFVDAMVSDNNDDVKEQLRQMEAKIDRLLQERAEQDAER